MSAYPQGGITLAKRANAAFFLRRSGHQQLQLDELLARIDVTEIHHDDRGPTVWGTWAPIGVEVHASLHQLDEHWLLQIGISLNTFFREFVGDDGGDLPLANDPGLPLALAFRDACLRLGAEVAFFTTNPSRGTDEFALGQEPLVRAGRIDELPYQGYALLFLDEKLQYQAPYLQARDEIEFDQGRLIFAGRGSARWF